LKEFFKDYSLKQQGLKSLKPRYFWLCVAESCLSLDRLSDLNQYRFQRFCPHHRWVVSWTSPTSKKPQSPFVGH